MSHQIRLGSGWESEAFGDGRTRHLRKFGKPTNLTDERVLLIGAVPSPENCTLNGRPIALPADVTEQLLPRNQLVVVTRDSEPPAGITLEIHDTSSPS
jgi:hypothetical protein